MTEQAATDLLSAVGELEKVITKGLEAMDNARRVLGEVQESSPLIRSAIQRYSAFTPAEQADLVEIVSVLHSEVVLSMTGMADDLRDAASGGDRA